MLWGSHIIFFLLSIKINSEGFDETPIFNPIVINNTNYFMALKNAMYCRLKSYFCTRIKQPPEIY